MTRTTLLVLGTLLTDPAREIYGLEIVTRTGLKGGTVYPILARLEGYGWVESRWEDTGPAMDGRPRRRFYQFTEAGRAQAAARADRIRGLFTPQDGTS